jgi:hypothetical protein
MPVANLTLREEAYHLAEQLFGSEVAGSDFANQLVNVCTGARGRDFLIVHNPGGWGHARLDQCLGWERSVVTGIKDAMEGMGYSVFLMQYFRSGTGWRERMHDLREQIRFFISKASIMSAWLQFIMTHTGAINVILVGISQGAAFSNAVMQQLGGNYPIYSIELGCPLQYKSRRVITEKTLALEDSGVQPDALAQGNLWVGVGIFVAAFFKWVWYHLRGKRVALAYCVTAPGHEYDWANPQLQRRIKDFLKANFSTKGKK